METTGNPCAGGGGRGVEEKGEWRGESERYER